MPARGEVWEEGCSGSLPPDTLRTRSPLPAGMIQRANGLYKCYLACSRLCGYRNVHRGLCRAFYTRDHEPTCLATGVGFHVQENHTLLWMRWAAARPTEGMWVRLARLSRTLME